MAKNKKTKDQIKEDLSESEVSKISVSAPEAACESEINEILEVENNFFLDAKDFRFVFCRGCGSEMRSGIHIICSDCIGDKVEDFYKAATDN